MNDSQPPRLWFRAKVYGYGWYPDTWQGWSIVLLYVFLVVVSAWDILGGTDTGAPAVKAFVVRTVFLTIFLVYISYIKGEKPRWRWGKDDTHHADPTI